MSQMREPRPEEEDRGRWILMLLVMACLIVTVHQVAKPRTAAAAWSDQWQQSLEAAQQQGKPVLALFTAGADPRCARLEREILSHPEVDGRLRRFVLVRLETSRRNTANMRLARHLDVDELPAVVLLNERGEEAGCASGPGAPETLARLLDAWE
jgi:thiol:disulfide interchange protein